MKQRRHPKVSGAAIYFRRLHWKEEAPKEGYPFTIPAVRDLENICLEQPVTFLVGENGSGKSTVLEAIAKRAGFNAEGGSRNHGFATRASHSNLWEHIRLVRGLDRMRDGFFLRAESFYNLATVVEELGLPERVYGAHSLHELSHGESFFTLLRHRLRGNGFYCFDEPEAALSPQRQLAMLALMHQLVKRRGQMVIATHSPILLAYPNAAIYLLDEAGVRPVAYEETEHYQLTKLFLNETERVLRGLFAEENDLFADDWHG